MAGDAIVEAMRRRVMDVSRLKRLPVRKTKTVEPVQTRCGVTACCDGRHYTSSCSSLLYIKLFSGWSVIVLLDLLVGFRLEYHVPSLHVPAQCPGLLQVPRASEQHTCTSATVIIIRSSP